MKKITVFLMMCTICLMAMAQGNLTPQAQMKIAQRKAKIARVSKGQALAPAQQRMRLVVKVAEENAQETYAQLRAAGAEIQGKIGRQAIISIPINQIDALQHIKGVKRIDTGHKGNWKTDVTRNETGINLINGTTTTVETPYTGQGVTVCVFDNGMDFQHPAFKDANGNSRIKCVFMIGDNTGNQFTVEDPEAGTIVYPGSVYDTPEQIATLTTDSKEEYHGTHTTSIAAGSVSPMGFGGMAPEADIVYIGFSEEMDESQLDENFEDEEDVVELVLAFATAYAQKSGKPLVFNGSLNSQLGPHDGTGTVPEALDAASSSIIPVMSAGNEGGYPIHLYRKFTERSSSFKTILALMEQGKDYIIDDESIGYTRTGDRVGIKIGLLTINQFTGKTKEVWNSEEITAVLGEEPKMLLIDSNDDPTLSQYFDGYLGIATQEMGNGRLSFGTMASGILKGLNLVQLTISGSNGTEIDMWDNFGGFNIFEFPGFEMGDSDISGGDWTSTSNVISVGAYCANTNYRSYDGSPMEDEDDDYKTGDCAWFSSYGTMFNGITQPVVSAPGVNIVSAWNHYYLNEGETVLDNMQWQGYPYGAESGTSMSSPVVSGIVACWLQANPNLTLDDVKEVLRETSVNDSYTLKNPIRWGYGKINAAKGIEYILSHTAIRGVHETTASYDGAIYDLQGRQVTSPTHGIYIKDGHKFVVK